jgi:curved DNA-binding protein CbpA
LRAELVEAARAAGVRTHFEVLGVAREASDAAVRAAYLRLAQRYHPDIQHDPELSGLKPQIEAAFARVGEAYKVLADPERRVAYEAALLVHALGEPASAAAPEPAAAPDPAAEQQRAEDLLAAAEALSSEGKHWDALRQCEDLLPLAQGKTRRRARVLLAECYLKNPNWRKQAEAELLDAIQEDAENAEALLLLGRVYRQEGMPTRAAAMLRRVLELRPRHAAAAQELAELSGDAPPVAPRRRS